MTYPPEFTAYAWEDLPSENTPVDKVELNAAEKRLAKFAEEYQGVNWRVPVKKESELNSLYKPKGTNVRIGDVAFVYELNEIFVYGASEEWKPIVVEALHWKAPAKKESELPTGGNTIGDIRFVEEAVEFYHCIGTTGTVAEQWQSGHWRPPVKKVSELPSEALNKNGDVIYVEDTERNYVWNSGSKEWVKRTRTVNASKLSTLPVEVHNVQGDIGWAETEKRLYIWNATAKEWQLEKLTGEAIVFTQGTLSLEKVKTGEKSDEGFVRVGANEEAFIRIAEGKLAKGTVKFKLFYNGVAQKFTVGGETPEVTTGATEFKLETPITLASKDSVKLEITNETGTPEGLAITVFVEHKIKLEVS